MSPIDVALVRALRERATREATGLYVVEGARFAVAAVDARAEVVATVIAPSALRTPMAQMMTRRLRQRGVPELRVSEEELAELACAREPQGVLLVLRQRRVAIDAIRPPSRALWLVIDGVRSPGNLGTALRTAHATGVDGVVMVRGGREGAADPFDPACARASMGAIVSTNVIDADVDSLRAFASRTGTRLVAAVPRARHDYRAVSYRGATALVLGSERQGASDAVIDACDLAVRIPMATAMDSLNAAVASAVLLYEAYGQRRRA
ncbi:TrmH family RNA methyltransferase [Sandaracinus amylolyticus]|uniref:TrmH family RNA methyltransferase n=1 Tax=Sandaracinus amylolyticus TaxID=927083 RepID=UPI001F34089C|nr:RNA methyltransferase [Sandaracinus amylolyticus]UJR82058.1 23S rRNA (Guanosine-2'-O-)-methyltransferase rlmB [Sandaracinus amylolyticus]